MGDLITVECRGPRGSRTRTIVVDGSPILTTSRDVLRVIGVRSGTSPDLATLAEQVAEHANSCANERALRLLSYRERTRCGLEAKLTDDGYSESCISSVLDRLEELQLLSDERFAACFTRDKARAGWGTRRIRNELIRAGVATEMAQATLEAEYPGTDDERAHAYALAARPSTDKDVVRLIGRLVRRGYSESCARKAAFAARDITRSEPDTPSSC